MGQLVFVQQFQGNFPSLDARWFFRNARHTHRTTGGYEFDLTLDFPVALHIHFDTFDHAERGGMLRVQIRRWIEANLTSSVLLLEDNRSYYIVHPSNRSFSDRHHEHVRHGYVVLRFGDDAEAVLFALAHSDIITRTPERYHPNRLPPAGAELRPA